MSSSSTRRSEPRRARRSRLRSFVTALQVIVLLGIGSSVGVGLSMFVSLSSVLPKIQDAEAPEATIIYSSDNVILGRLFREDRTNVPLKDIPKLLREATVAIEDERFYNHSGIDMRGIARALWENIRGRRQGGSTITQQLARSVYLTQRKTVERKAQEVVLALLMERHFTKDKILELYLNRVYYGSGSFGVQAASKVYFGKDVKQLDLSESALLAGLPQRPSGHSPHEDMEAALRRRDTVLKSMGDQGYISPEQREHAENEKIAIIPRARGRSTYKAAHFVDYVTSQLRRKYPDEVLFSGGLRVYTTLNYQMQLIAEQALRQGVKKFERSSKVTEGCFVAIEPQSGYVRAMVGSVDPNSQFNRCTQGHGRQPGSSFKAFVYSAAFAEGGKTPRDRVLDSPKSWPGVGGKRWAPRNYDGRYRGRVTIMDAVAKSMNMPAIRTADEVGVQNVIKYAQLMGIHAELEPYLPLAIGGIKGVHPIEMASAYGTFANNGVHVEPCAVIRVTNSRGETIEDYTPEGQQVLTEKVNAMMDECFRAVVTRGTGATVRGVPEARGKTGTTNDDRDAWFIGYIPQKMVAACWVGNDNNASMRGAYGGKVCGPIWREFMEKSIPILDKIRKDEEKADARSAAKPEAEPAPKGIGAGDTVPKPDSDAIVSEDGRVVTARVCDDTGLLPTATCPAWHKKRFARGTEPTAYCATHQPEVVDTQQEQPADDTPDRAVTQDRALTTVTVCSETGQLAGPGCPRVTKRIPVDEVPSTVCSLHGHRGR